MAAEFLNVYKSGCGMVIEVTAGGDCEPSCCGEPMQLLQLKSQDTGMEKHLPVIEEIPGGVKVKVGAVPHPMEEKHFIEWIEVLNGPYVNRKHLKPGEAPEAEFALKAKPGMKVRIYCNIHGLWGKA